MDSRWRDSFFLMASRSSSGKRPRYSARERRSTGYFLSPGRGSGSPRTKFRPWRRASSLPPQNQLVLARSLGFLLSKDSPHSGHTHTPLSGSHTQSIPQYGHLISTSSLGKGAPRRTRRKGAAHRSPPSLRKKRKEVSPRSPPLQEKKRKK